MGLLTKETEIGLRSQSIKYYEEKGYVIPKYKNKKGKLVFKNGIKYGGNNKSKSIICLTTHEIFNSINNAAKFYNIGPAGISHCCQGVYKYDYYGVHPITNKPLKWMYFTDYQKLHPDFTYNEKNEEDIILSNYNEQEEIN